MALKLNWIFSVPTWRTIDESSDELDDLITLALAKAKLAIKKITNKFKSLYILFVVKNYLL